MSKFKNTLAEMNSLDIHKKRLVNLKAQQKYYPKWDTQRKKNPKISKEH